jgi:GNAT superfamily N-acetyltransferase
MSFEPDYSAFQQSFGRLISEDSGLLLIADERGAACGYLLGFIHDALFANGPVAWVEEVMVDERQRRTGIGTELVSEFESWSRERGAKLIALATRRASAFYEALGFEESAAYFRKLL